ncbi:hypothetical protein [Nonomuraea turcica]|uniref:hypothetical protein n=1 Tax=Nonomuraea sp. G32 TaxID=3067274 RepID=UPI00273C9897|nr:hypothetical protein [Nonomuraea sp. G32]MDP4512163.1 hypothetical protein [Nonomuraea sp. G32]
MNTSALIRLILRRDRVWQPVWIWSVTFFVATTVATIGQLLPPTEARLNYDSEIIRNPVILLLQGPAYGDSLGAAAAQQRGRGHHALRRPGQRHPAGQAHPLGRGAGAAGAGWLCRSGPVMVARWLRGWA